MSNKPKTMSNIGQSCLILDGDEILVDVFHNMIRPLNLFRHIITSTDPVDAKIKIKNQGFDLLIMDPKMPKIDGVNYLERIIAGIRLGRTEPMPFNQQSFVKRDVEEGTDGIDLRQRLSLGDVDVLTEHIRSRLPIVVTKCGSFTALKPNSGRTVLRHCHPRSTPLSFT